MAGNEPLLGVFGLVGCVLLIACFNVANLQLGRSISRQKEIAVRLGIGAGRGRLMRQLVTENFALFLAGAIASVLVAVGLTRWLAGAIPPIVRQYLPYRADLTVDSRALLYTLLVGSVTGLIFGLAPALECRGFDINRSLKEGAARVSGGRIRNGLIVVEIALAMLVLVSAGLLVKGLVRMYAGALGFDPRGVTTATVFTSQLQPRQIPRGLFRRRSKPPRRYARNRFGRGGNAASILRWRRFFPLSNPGRPGRSHARSRFLGDCARLLPHAAHPAVARPHVFGGRSSWTNHSSP